MTLGIGRKIYKLVKKLFPINRSITGRGNRKTLSDIKKIIKNLKIKEYKSGQKVFDWKIPSEWNVNEAYVKLENKKIINFKNNNLHLISYSTNVNKYVNKKELLKHIHVHKKSSSAIPYKTSYYKKYWGFCISKDQKKKIKGNKFHVKIDSNFKKNGSLTIGELYIRGKSPYEILLSANICHPSLANNELSGPTILTYISKYLEAKKNNYSYRILFIPETIGSITYLSKNLENLKKRIIAGFHLTCIGDKGNFSMIETKNANSYSDKVAKEVIKKFRKSKIYKFTECGSDERQYNYPGIDLPIVTLMRSRFGTFKEYHSSKDNLQFINPRSLEESYNFVKNIIRKIEKNYNYDYRLFAKTKCEPFLSKRNIFRSLAGNKLTHSEKILFNVLYYADGRRISDLKQVLKCNYDVLVKNIELLNKHKLIKKVN